MSHLKQVWNAALLAALSVFAVIGFAHDAFAQHSHGAPAAAKPVELGASVAFDRQGRLWTVRKETSDEGTPFVTLRTSTDMGKTWSDTIRLVQDRVSARGEERPKIAFGLKDESTLSIRGRPWDSRIRTSARSVFCVPWMAARPFLIRSPYMRTEM